jgi:alpha-glucosidase
MADFDRLLAETHQRGLKLILDLVPNHTSDEHPWFIESRSSKDNPKRDWYIWADPAPDGGPPNNWLSMFGGPAWTYDEKSGQYYLHQFDTHQPELNYRNPEVMEAMLDNMRFWLDKGIDGFRVDVIWLMLKDEELRDEPANPDFEPNKEWPHLQLDHIYTQNLPGVHDLIRRMRQVLEEYEGEQIMIGEIYLATEEQVKYYGKDHDECHLPYNFQLILADWEAQTVRRLVDEYEAALPEGAWPNWVLGNHDQHRIATRVGREQARVANMLLLTLRGTPTSYYGEEIGMENVHIPPELAKDPPAVNQPELADQVGRDPARTPMQWDASPRAGFTAADVTPWLPLADDFRERNVAQQEQDPQSMLSLYRALSSLRQAEPALAVGDYTSVEAGVADVFAYVRTPPSADDRFLVVLNFGAEAHPLDLCHVCPGATIALATGLDRTGPVDLSELALGPNEGLLLRMSAIPTELTE